MDLPSEEQRLNIAKRALSILQGDPKHLKDNFLYQFGDLLNNLSTAFAEGELQSELVHALTAYYRLHTLLAVLADLSPNLRGILLDTEVYKRQTDRLQEEINDLEEDLSYGGEF